MDQQSARYEQPEHKSVNVYFADIDGYVYCVFGFATDCILAHRCFFVDDDLHHAPMMQLPYDRFVNWIDLADIVRCDNGGATFKIRNTTPYTDDWTDALGCDIATLERARRVAVVTDHALATDDNVYSQEKLNLWIGYVADHEDTLTDTLLLATINASGYCHRHYCHRLA